MIILFVCKVVGDTAGGVREVLTRYLEDDQTGLQSICLQEYESNLVRTQIDSYLPRYQHRNIEHGLCPAIPIEKPGYCGLQASLNQYNFTSF